MLTTRYTVSLAALAANYRALRNYAQGEVAAVVKANAYGVGAAAVATRLCDEGCRSFFVANVAEGQRLRAEFPAITIYVLEGALEGSVKALCDAGLIPVLNTLEQVHTWLPTQRAAALHVDTGMQRLGLAVAELDDLPEALNVELLVSHFACADAGDVDNNRAQVERMNEVAATLRQRYPGLALSLNNSAGILGDLVPDHLSRGGIALYGGNPFLDAPASALNVQPVVKFEAMVLQVRDVPSGQGVGYGATYCTEGDTTLATLGAGYADGIPRLLSNSGHGFHQGVALPFVGRVSMDLLTIDATAVVAAGFKVGDWVELIGPHQTLDDVAELARTISYEVLTGLGRRTPIEYSQVLLS